MTSVKLINHSSSTAQKRAHAREVCGRRFREFWKLMDDLAAPFRGKAAIQPFENQTGFDGDKAAAAGNAGGDLREEAIQTADHEI